MLIDKLRCFRNATIELDSALNRLKECERNIHAAAQDLEPEVKGGTIEIGDIVKLDGYYYRLERPGKTASLKFRKQCAVKEFN